MNVGKRGRLVVRRSAFSYSVMFGYATDYPITRTPPLHPQPVASR